MAIDANLESVEEDGVMEVFGYMKKLRQARRGLVETLVNLATPFPSTAFHILFIYCRSNTSSFTIRLRRPSLAVCHGFPFRNSPADSNRNRFATLSLNSMNINESLL